MTLTEIQNILATHGILLTITPKAVKNVNFHVGVGQVTLSIPKTFHPNDDKIIAIIHQRLDWIINVHQKSLAKQASKAKHSENQLWGEPYQFANETEKKANL